MLVLTRKVGERILVGKDVEIVLLSVGGRRAKVGVTAPSDITVLREELRGRPQKSDLKFPPRRERRRERDEHED